MSPVTTQDVLSFDRYLKKLGSDPNLRKKNQSLVNQQRNEEKKALSSMSTCPSNFLPGAREKLSTVDIKQLAKIKDNQFYNVNAMLAMACLSEAVYFQAPYKTGALSASNSIRNWFRDLRQIGAPSVDGAAMSASLKDTSGMMVIKTAKDPNNQDFIHELFVGTVLNSLRSEIPNFAYVYGGFRCRPALINQDDKQVVSWCTDQPSDSDINVNYVLYENVFPSVDARSAMSNISRMGFLSMMVQICLATQRAYELHQYTHYDLHSENVLLRDPKDAMNQKYGTAGDRYFLPMPHRFKKVYVPVTKIATIIDYGRSYVTDKGRSYGYELIEGSIFPDRPFPMFDIYKFLMFCGQDALAGKVNREALTAAELVFRFFNKDDDFVNAIKREREAFYQLPLNSKTKNLKIPDLVDHIAKEEPKILVTALPSGSQVVGCDGECLNYQKIMSKVTVEKPPSSVIDYFEQTKVYSKDQARIRQLNKSFASVYRERMSSHINQVDKMLARIEQTVNQISVPQVAGNQAYIFSAGGLNNIQKVTNQVAAVRDQMVQVKFYLDAGSAVAYRSDVSTLRSYQQNYLRLAPQVNDLIRSMTRLSSQVKDVYQSPYAVQVLRTREGRKYMWYRNTLFQVFRPA